MRFSVESVLAEVEIAKYEQSQGIASNDAL